MTKHDQAGHAGSVQRRIANHEATSVAAEEEERTARTGAKFKPSDLKWVLDKDNIVYLDVINGKLCTDAMRGFTQALAVYAETKSASHTRNIADRMTALLKEAGADRVGATMLINYRASLSRENEWKLATLAGFFKKWCRLGYGGIDENVADLLDDWVLKGNIKGDAVKRLDPTEGPLTDNELAAFNEGMIRAFERGQIKLADLAMALLVSHTGRRPRQLVHLKNVDLEGTKKNSKGEQVFIVNIPRAKQRGEVFRESFKSFVVSRELWLILEAHRRRSISIIEALVGHELSNSEKAGLPLFPDVGRVRSLKLFESGPEILDANDLHLAASSVTALLKKLVVVANVRSERTGEHLNALARRFRYTKGTRAAREGFDHTVIAELLDHNDVQNVAVYTQNLPDHAKRLNEAVAHQLAPYAQAFQGVLVDLETHAKRGTDPASKIRFKGEAAATCGHDGSCGANVPIPCYTCIHFQPWLHGPHDALLAELVAERQRVLEITGDQAMASVNDRTILAVAEVVQRCAARKIQLETGVGAT